jgi:peptide/nickel transport system ATP-binding protein
MIYQEPMTSLNPLLTVGSQLAEIVAAHGGLTGAANRARCVDLLAAVNIADAEKVYAHMPYRLSGGMRQRVMIAAALASEPELIIADEPTTALDVTTQAQIPDLFADLRRRVNSAFIFVTHDLGVIAEIADRAAVVYAGYVVEECSVAELFAAPAHPYTFGLMAARQKRRFGNTAPLYTIPGTVPTPGTHGPGCPFAPRCARATALCAAAVPPLAEITGGHKARCWALDKNG